MKIERYHGGLAIVSELQAGRAALISPGEAARTEIAKFGAIAGVVGSISQSLAMVGEVRERARAAEGEVEHKINENNLTAGYKSLSNDPNLKKDVQDDGTTTSEYFEREAEALIKTYKEGISRIQDPEARKRAEQVARSREQLLRVEIAADAGVIETRVAGDKLYSGFVTSLRNGDTAGARELISTGTSEGLLDPKTKESWITEVEQQEIKTEATNHIQFVDEGYEISEEEGRSRLNALVKDTSISKDVRDIAIDGSEERASEWGRARAKEREQQEVNAILAYGNDNTRARFGDLTYEEVDASYESGKYGEGKGGATRRNQLTAAVTTGIKARETQLDVGQAIRNGQFINNDKKSRDALSRHEQSVTGEMDRDTAIVTIGDISKIAGTVSTQTSRTLNLGNKSKEAAQISLPLYQELTKDEARPDLHTTGDELAFLEDASQLMDAGVPMTAAIETAWENKTPSDTEKENRKLRWENVGVTKANESFDELLESKRFDEPGFWDVAETPTLMRIEYDAVYKAMFDKNGNDQAAKNLADDAISRTWSITNFGADDPDDYRIEKYGLRGDTRAITKASIRELDAESFAEEITFRSFNDKNEAFDEEGNQRFKVLRNGQPFYRVTGDGLEVVTLVVDSSKIDEFSNANQERRQVEQRIKDIEREEKELTALSESNIYFGGRDIPTPIPFGAKRRKERVTALGREKVAKKKELTNIKQVRF